MTTPPIYCRILITCTHSVRSFTTQWPCQGALWKKYVKRKGESRASSGWRRLAGRAAITRTECNACGILITRTRARSKSWWLYVISLMDSWEDGKDGILSACVPFNWPFSMWNFFLISSSSVFVLHLFWKKTFMDKWHGFLKSQMTFMSPTQSTNSNQMYIFGSTVRHFLHYEFSVVNLLFSSSIHVNCVTWLFYFTTLEVWFSPVTDTLLLISIVAMEWVIWRQQWRILLPQSFFVGQTERRFGHLD